MNNEMFYQDDQFSEDQIEAINMLEEEGLKLISTPLQIKHGTLMFKDTELKNVYYSITKSGYARRHLKGEVFSPWARKNIPQTAMYQLNKKRPESMYSASEDRYTELSRITQPGDYSGLADIIIKVVNGYRRNNPNESKQENGLRARTVNESLNEDIFSHPEAWTYKPGDEVRFYMKDVSPADFGDEDEGELAASHDKMKAVITAQATATATMDELGDKNYEYYDIEFGDGVEISGVSGYHLEPTYNKKR